MKKAFKITIMAVLLFGALSFLWTSPGFAGYLGSSTTVPTSDLTTEGGTEEVLYKSDTITLENTVTDDAQFTAPTPERINVGGGLSMFYSKNLQIYYLPITYTFMQMFMVSTSIPYINRKLESSGNSYSAKGLGDVKVGFSYFNTFGETLNSISNLKISLPTGDADASDGNFSVPLGNGGYSFSLMQSLSNQFELLRLFGNIGLVYYLQSKYSVGIYSYKEDRGWVANMMLGVEYFLLQNLALIGKLNYVYVAEGKLKFNGYPWADSNDHLQTSDIIPGCKYIILKDILSVYLSFLIPIYTKHDPDATGAKKRKWGVNFGITGVM